MCLRAVFLIFQRGFKEFFSVLFEKNKFEYRENVRVNIKFVVFILIIFADTAYIFNKILHYFYMEMVKGNKIFV